MQYSWRIGMFAIMTTLALCSQTGLPAQFECEPLIEEEPGYELYAFQMSKGIRSPVGTKVAFITGHSYQDEEIVVWDYERDILTNVTRNFGKRSCYGRLVWSPGGDAIAAPLHPLPGMGNSLHILHLELQW